MPQPWKHPTLGTWYYRKVVPKHLRKTLGRTEIRLPLNTSDARTAKLRFPEKAAEADAMLARAAGLCIQRETLADSEIARLAALYVHDRLAEDDDARLEGSAEEDALYLTVKRQVEAAGGEATFSDEDASASAGMSQRAFERLNETLDFIEPAYREALARGDITIIEEEVEELLESQGIALAQSSPAYRKLAYEILKAAVRACEAQRRRQSGEVVETPPAPAFQPRQMGYDPETRGSRRFDDLFELWAAERNPAKKTLYSWKKIIDKFANEVGTDDAGLVTRANIIDWKTKLIASNLAPKTIGNRLTIIKTFLGWCTRNEHIPRNPAENVEYHPKHDPIRARISYTDQDARLILSAARKEAEPHKRWVPWLMAFSGARCDEICGAMVSDVRKQDGITCLRISPEDREAGGSVKTRASIRTVPLHSAIIGEGFLEYVASLPQNGPLFPDLRPDRFGKRGGTGSKNIGRWVRRDLGITDRRKAPSHSWRHRFADECRRLGIAREIRFAIEGHALSDVGDKYGSPDYPVQVLAATVEKLPNPLSVLPSQSSGEDSPIRPA